FSRYHHTRRHDCDRGDHYLVYQKTKKGKKMKGISEALFKQLIFDVVAEHMATMPEEAVNRLLGLINYYTTQPQWHVVADGDLPLKRPERGFLYLYIVTYTDEDGPRITPRTGLAWYDCKGEWIGYNEEIDGFESGDVLAWRELPEPWEGDKTVFKRNRIRKG
ncbi:MAG: hypothetical protein ACLS76_09570, partial [Eubacterium callanderi]